jgi:clan AA aspartic protease (TIGR02281 family)
MRPVIFAVIAAFWVFGTGASLADTVYLKNGNSIEGLVKRESPEFVELDVGCGTIQLSQKEISSISRSTPEESSQLQEKWKAEKQEAGHRDVIAKEQRSQEWEKWKARKEQAKEAEEEEESQEVSVSPDKQHIIVDALLNAKVHAKFILDTGATFVVITPKIARDLGLESALIKEKIKLIVGDGRELEGKYTVLKSVSVQGVEASNIEAAILPDNIKEIGSADGALGMSFLKNFSFRIDPKNNKLVLEKQK